MRRYLPLIAALAFAGEAQAQAQTQTQTQPTPPPAPPSPPDNGPPAICTDRPTKSNNACAVDPGYWQVETDLFNGTFQRLDGVTTDTWYVTNPTLKYGLVKNVDVEVNIAPYEIVRTHGPDGDHTLGGAGDLFLRVKYMAFDNGNGGVQIGLIPYVKAPTARSGLGDGAWETGISTPINIKLNDQWGLTFSPEFDALKDQAGGGRHFNTSQTVSLTYSFPKDITVSGELWGDFNVDPAGTVRQYSLDFAATKLLGKLLQIDGGVNIGLNRATPGVQVYAGVSKKW